MFVRLRRLGRGDQYFLGLGLLGGVPSFFRFEGEGDHIGRFECCGKHGAAVLGVHPQLFYLELPPLAVLKQPARAVLNASIKDPLVRLADGFELARRLARVQCF